MFNRRFITVQELFFMVFEKIREILAAQFDVEEDSITLDTDIQQDLNADSLDIVDIMMSIEDEFDFEVPDEAVEEVKTVADLVKYIEDNQ